MNRGNSNEKIAFNRSGSQDSLDDLSLEDYWTEVEDIKKNTDNSSQEEQAVVVKVPDEGEQEEEWLKEAGLSILFGESTADSQESMVFLSTLTRTQSAAVQKRIDTFTQTLRKKNKQHQIPDVRDVFRQPQELKKKDEDLNGFESTETKNGDLNDKSDCTAQNNDSKEELTVPEESPVPVTDINLEISFAEQASNLKEFSVVKNEKEDDSLLPNFRVPQDKTGITKVGDLAPQDMKKVLSLALIELTALFDVLGTDLKLQRAAKLKFRESGLFKVPLTTLLEQDQKRVPGTRVPLIFQSLIHHIENEGLDTEGILRIPGVSTRIKAQCQELEAKFYEGTFNWDTVKQHDAASLLKFFIRELPLPLLTVEYLKAFHSVQYLPTKKNQLQALNLLVILLPDVHRDTLKALLEFLQRVVDHREQNKMILRNVAMVMAPNLFTLHNSQLRTVDQVVLASAARTASVMLLMIKYQNLLWTRIMAKHLSAEEAAKFSMNADSDSFPDDAYVFKRELQQKAQNQLSMQVGNGLAAKGLNNKTSGAGCPFKIPKFIVGQVRQQNTANQKKLTKEKAMKKILKRMAYDREKYEKAERSLNDSDVPQGFIRVQAPQFSKVSMAIQLTEELKAGDILARFLSQDGGTSRNIKKEEVCLYEIGGNIGERCLEDGTYMKDLSQLNPSADWVIKPKSNV